MWECIEEIYKDKSKEFKSGNYTICWFEHKKILSKIGIVHEKYGVYEKEMLIDKMLDRDWTLVQKPVSFIEALQSGKDFKLQHRHIGTIHYDYELKQFLQALLYEQTKEELKDIFTEGKFYIKE